MVVRRYEAKMDTLEEMDTPDDEREASLDISYTEENDRVRTEWYSCVLTSYQIFDSRVNKMIRITHLVYSSPSTLKLSTNWNH